MKKKVVNDWFGKGVSGTKRTNHGEEGHIGEECSPGDRAHLESNSVDGPRGRAQKVEFGVKYDEGHDLK